jgi:hypothetical protein
VKDLKKLKDLASWLENEGAEGAGSGSADLKELDD